MRACAEEIVIGGEAGPWGYGIRTHAAEGAAVAFQDKWFHACQVVQPMKRVKVWRFQPRVGVEFFGEEANARIYAVRRGGKLLQVASSWRDHLDPFCRQ